MSLTWQGALIVAAACVLAAVVARFSGRPKLVFASAFGFEICLILVFYAVWMIAGSYAIANPSVAFPRGQDIWDFERSIHLPSEVWLQSLFLGQVWLVKAMNVFYATVHFPSMMIFLVWIFVRHRDKYSVARALVLVFTGISLAIQFRSVAPPRLYPQLGFVDTARKYGQSVYMQSGHASDPLSAMPSVHVGWSLLIAIMVIWASTSRWRYLILLETVTTIVVVTATANHWWMDGIVAAAIVLAALALIRVLPHWMLGPTPGLARTDVSSGRPLPEPLPDPEPAPTPIRENSDLSPD